jgi:hypothetical protein
MSITRASKTVAIIQSSYIPWKGYFDIIHDADLFIFHDDLQFTKQDWRSRNRIKMPGGARWLSVPVCGRNESRLICETTPAAADWQVKHHRKLVNAYGRTPHFARLRPFLDEVYLGRTWATLSELNQHVITHLAREHLGIRTELVDSRLYAATGAKTDRVLDLLTKAGATRYVSGPAGRDYLDEVRFVEAGIELVYKDYGGYPEYVQPHPPFEHHVTILDLLSCVGPAAPDYIWGWRSRGAGAS